MLEFEQQYNELPFGTQESNKSQRAFIIPYAKQTRPYINYEEETLRSIVMPAVLILSRWDGAFGFPGGFVDPGENIEEAAKREFEREEIGIKLPGKIVPFKTLADSTSNIHTYLLEVPENVLYKIRNASIYAPHCPAEHGGAFIWQLFYKGDRGINIILNNQFAGSARQELLALIKMLKDYIPQ